MKTADLELFSLTLYPNTLTSFSDALQAGASQFEASAGKLKRKYWWKNCKVSYGLKLKF